MTRRRRSTASIAALLLAVACFSESAADEQPSATSDPSPCEPGLSMCACRDDGTCDPGLECVAAAQICAPRGCTPGALACVCVDGSCLDELECEGGFCVAPSTSTTTNGSTESSTTLEPTTSRDDATSEDPSSGDGVTTDDMCNAESCGTCADCPQCLACAVESGGPCEDERAACTGECETLLGCVDSCEPGPSQCPMTCCCQSTTAWEPFNALMACLYDQCTTCARPLCATLEC